MSISFFILNLFNAFAFIYAESKLLESKIGLKNKNFYIILVVLATYSFLAYFITKTALRTIIYFHILNACSIYLFKNTQNNLGKIIMANAFSYVLYMLTELIVVFGLSLLFNLVDINNPDAYNNELLAIFIISLCILLISLKPIKRPLIKLLNKLANIKFINIIFYIWYIILILVTFGSLLFFDLSRAIKFFLLILSIFELSYILVVLVTNYEKKEKIQHELNLILSITSEYENSINESRIKNHENKNQFIILKDLIKTDRKRAIIYADSIIKNNFNDDEDIALKTANLPTGGLKGLIYYKLLLMKSKNIECHIEVSKEIKQNVLNNIDISLLQSYYKIIGVFIDNSIEEIETQKKKIILIEMYLEDGNLIFSISNEVQQKIDFEKIGNQKFTTKGDNHGYGLQLVKELIDANNDLFNQKELVGNLFVQRVGLKIKR